MADPLPCPFCGGVATMDAVDKVSAAHNFYHVSFVRISCLNGDCPAKPEIDMQERSGLEDTKAAAVSAWNRRAKSQ